MRKRATSGGDMPPDSELWFGLGLGLAIGAGFGLGVMAVRLLFGG
jgi:hypothetical protein